MQIQLRKKRDVKMNRATQIHMIIFMLIQILGVLVWSTTESLAQQIGPVIKVDTEPVEKLVDEGKEVVGGIVEGGKDIIDNLDDQTRKFFDGLADCSQDPQECLEKASQGLMPASISTGSSKDEKLAQFTRWKTDGWEVYPGDEINENHYIRFIEIVVDLVRSQDPEFEPLIDFVKGKLDDQIDAIEAQIEGLQQRLIMDLILRAVLQGGKIQKWGGYEIDVGFIKYNDWFDISVKNPVTGDGLFHEKINGPSKFVPYIRWRGQTDLLNLDTIMEHFNQEVPLDQIPPGGYNKKTLEIFIRSAIKKEVENFITVTPVVEKFLSAPINDAMKGYNNVTPIPVSAVPSIIQGILPAIHASVMEKLANAHTYLTVDWVNYSNRDDVRQKIRTAGGGDWTVLWGVNIGEVEQVSIAASIFAGAFGKYVENYLERTAEKIRRQSEEIADKLLKRKSEVLDGLPTHPENLMAGGDFLTTLITLKEVGESVAGGNFSFEMHAGLAKYERKIKVDLPLNLPELPARPSFPPWLLESLKLTDESVWRVLDFLILGNLLTAYEDLRDGEIEMPDHYQPWIRFKYDIPGLEFEEQTTEKANLTWNAGFERDAEFQLVDELLVEGFSDNIQFNQIPSGVLNRVYVDGRASSGGNGLPTQPFNTVSKGVEAVEPNGAVVITSGSYKESLTIDKPVILLSIGGTTVIGK